MKKIIIPLTMSIGICSMNKSFASNRYDDLIKLIENQHTLFIDFSEQKYAELNNFKNIWIQIDDSLKELESNLEFNIDAKSNSSDELMSQLQTLMNEKIYVENVLGKLLVLRPKIEIRLNQSDDFLAQYPDIRAISQTTASTILKNLSDLESTFQERKANVDANLKQWQQWQMDLAASAQVENQQAIVNNLDVISSLGQVDTALSVMNTEFLLAIGNHNYDDAENILEGFIWLKSTFPLYFADKIFNDDQSTLLKNIQNEADSNQSDMSDTLANLATRRMTLDVSSNSTSLVNLKNKANFSMNKLRYIFGGFGGGGENGGGGTEVGTGGSENENNNERDDWDERDDGDRVNDNGRGNDGGAINMDPGSSGTRSTEIYDKDRNITISENIYKSICRYEDGQAEPTATVNIDGVIRIENNVPKEAVQIFSENNLKTQLIAEENKDSTQSFTQQFEVSCDPSKNPPQAPSDQPSNDSQNNLGKGLMGQRDNLDNILGNAINKPHGPKEKADLENLKNKVDQFPQVKNDHGKAPSDKMKEAADQEAKTLDRANKIPQKVKQAPAPMSPPSKLANGANATQKLGNLSKAILNYMLGNGAGNGLKKTISDYLGKLVETSSPNSAPYVKSALQKAQGIPRVINPMTDAVRAQIMKITQSCLAPGVKIRYSKKNRNAPNTFDCSSFVTSVLGQAGIDMRKPNGDAPNVEYMTKESNNLFHDITNKEPPKAGDLIVHFGETHDSDHVGIYDSQNNKGTVYEISATIGGEEMRYSTLPVSDPNFKSSITKYRASEFGDDWKYYRWNK